MHEFSLNNYITKIFNHLLSLVSNDFFFQQSQFSPKSLEVKTEIHYSSPIFDSTKNVLRIIKLNK